jgi:predicted RNA-binding Zn-ribbon protein involved in translation (DUF1610 family)
VNEVDADIGGNESGLSWIICTSGSCTWVVSLFMQPELATAQHCPECGERAIAKCQKCSVPIGDPTHRFCTSCGERLKGAPLPKLE